MVRAARFVAGIVGASPKDTPITVVGGHSGATIVPLLSQSPYGKTVTGEQYKALIHRIQFGGDEVVKAKDGAGSATLSMAYAGAKFTNSLLRGLSGEKGVITPTFVKSPLYADQGIDFFSSNVELGVSTFIISHVRFTDQCLSSSTVLRRSTPLAKYLPRKRNSWRPACLSSRKTLKRAELLLRSLSTICDTAW